MSATEVENIVLGFEALLPPHAASLTLEHNDHKSVYESVEQWSVDNKPRVHWVSAEQEAKAIAADSVWMCQWYPRTPVGFYCLAACDLSALIEAIGNSEYD